jgi:DNA-binding transcriptional MerR regulator
MRGNESTEGTRLKGLAEVVAATGLSKLVLHAWERRYGIVPVERTATGRRFYDSQQVERLRLLKICSDGGHRIGTLVSLPDSSLQRMADDFAATRALDDILAAVETLDGDHLHALLKARADTETPEAFVQKTALPLLREVGLRWANGTVTIAAEHMATAQVKRILGGLFDRYPPPASSAPRLVATTPEREEHDVGALIVTLLARVRGWNALFLGANLPAEEIVGAAHRRGVSHVCLSGLTGRPASLERQLRTLRSALSPAIEIWVGGRAYAAVPSMAGVTYFDTLDAFLEALQDHNDRLPVAV